MPWLLLLNLLSLDKLILAANISYVGRTLRAQVALYLDDIQIQLLDKLAKKHGRTKQDLLREAVNTLLKEYQMLKPPDRKP
jgi:ribbon-helix-helix CopG family protein